MYWVNFFHIYQPPGWSPRTIRKVVRESYQPVLHTIKRQPSLRITLNISGALTEQLHQYGYRNILQTIKLLAQRKQIELVGSAAYHAFLPLLPVREIKRQIDKNTEINRKHLGRVYRPVGFFPPEMAYNKKVGQVVRLLGFRWIFLDEIAINGQLQTASLKNGYLIKENGLRAIIRNRIISNYISFHSKTRSPALFWDAVNQDNRSEHGLVTAMDGENLGHHRAHLDRYWKTIVNHPGTHLLTSSEYIKKQKKLKTFTPRQSSWSSRPEELRRRNPFTLWHDSTNPVHALQWRLLNHLLKLVEGARGHPHYQCARALLDKRLASDQFWWASAKPWWSLTIITKKTKELTTLAQLIEKNGTAQHLAQRLLTQAQRWQTSKKFIHVADSYLRADKQDAVRIIGRKKITK